MHTVAFAASLYLPAGQGAPVLLADATLQNEPGADAHAPEHAADATGGDAAAPPVSLKPQPTLDESTTTLTHTGLGTQIAGVAPTPG